MTAGRRILVVDDELNIRGALVTLLEKKEYQVRGAASAEEALEQLETTPADLVLTDLKMPGMGGMEFLCRLKQKWPDIEVLVMTAFGLAVAIPAVLAYNVFGRLIARVEAELEGFAHDLLARFAAPAP